MGITIFQGTQAPWKTMIPNLAANEGRVKKFHLKMVLAQQALLG